MRVLGSITNRIFLASTLLATLSIGAAVFFVSTRMTRETEADLDRDLTEAATLVHEQGRMQFDHIARTARLIADLPKFKAVVDIGDRPTIEPIAEDYRQQAGADLLIVTGRRREVLAVSGDQTPGAHPPPDARLDGPVAPVFWAHARGVLEVVSVPVTLGLENPDVLGVLTMGYLLDDGRAAQFKALTGADIAFAIDGVVRASTMGAPAAPLLGTLLTGRTSRIVIGSDEYVALAQSLAPLGADGGPMALVLRSRSARLRTLAGIQAALAAIGLGAVLLAMVVSYAVARTITRPLATITDHMRQVAATGDLTPKIAIARHAGWDDDDARMVATTFNTLTDSIAKFQREAGQRERLSSLGRLSTVIAHEVRNPLMIIKGSLRTLSAGTASPADVRDAAQDIDEEIDRLNRLVNDVLDVARPIRIIVSATDINAVCRDAAAAAAAGGARITLALGPDLPMVQTDGERLRTVLINLLTNAQHAAEKTADAVAGARAEVRLTTEPGPGGRIAITVHDNGPGIPDHDLPRIFDPYFTTRRAGTGLGLAIAKNIVDSLGGAIGVTVTPGVGTAFRVDVGDAPAAREP